MITMIMAASTSTIKVKAMVMIVNMASGTIKMTIHDDDNLYDEIIQKY